MTDSINITLSRLEEAARRTPDKAAFLEPGGKTLTFAGLCASAYAAAAAIRAVLPEGDGPVVLLADRTAETAAAIYGAITAGTWYVPLDPDIPPERMRVYLSVCRPSLVLTHGGLERPFDFSGIPVVDTSLLAPLTEFVPVARPDTLPAFGIFTSGSTGMPKLVVKNRRAVEAFLDVYCCTFRLTEDEIFGNQIPFFFDASTKDLFATVWLGATTVLLPGRCFTFPMELIRTLNDMRVTTAVWVPSVLSYAARFGVLAAAKPETLRRVLFVGERMPVRTVNAWREALPETEFINLYGSTEVAGNSCFYRLNRPFADGDVLPIGRPFDGTRVFLLDPETGLPAPEGEICVAGPGLAEGYFGDAERTAATFVNVTLPDFSGRVYRSGDYGRVNEFGELVCVSRRDSQIKYLGHRIELGDIEVAAASLPYVNAAVCFFHEEKEKIILCAAAPADCKAQLRADLEKLLPDYMLPHRFRFFDEFPLNRNGKTDRAKLRELCGI